MLNHLRPLAMIKLPLFLLPLKSQQFKSSRSVLNLDNNNLFVRSLSGSLYCHSGLYTLYLFSSGTLSCHSGLRTPYLYLGLRTHLYLCGLRTNYCVWVYAPTTCLGFLRTHLSSAGTMHPHSPLGLCTLIHHWDYAPSFAMGTMYSHLSLDSRTPLIVRPI
jgi:hypothetical protein